jgi:hypothetical protein
MAGDQTLLVGFELDSGEEVKVPIFHTLYTGQTQLSGKSTAEKANAKQLAEMGYKILVFDSKENYEDYQGFGHEIPVCLRESTDPLVLLPLLESVFERRLPTGYFSVLADLSSNTKTFEEVIRKAQDREKSARSGWVQGVCRTLWELLERLENQLNKIETVSSLELPYDINRMVLNQFPQASQQLFIKNAFEDILHIHNKKTIPMLDECHKFLPQRWGSACARAIQDAITQLAITDSYVHLATQYLAPTNKDPLKACAVRLLGTQDHKTEAVHTLDLIPFRGVATEDDIMTLPIGHFYVTTKKWVKLTYFVPDGVSKEIGREVALRKKTSEWVRDNCLKPSQLLEGANEEMYKAKSEELAKRLEEEKQRREKVEKELTEAVERVLDGNRNLSKTLENTKKEAELLHHTINEKDEYIHELESENEKYKNFQAALIELLPLPIGVPVQAGTKTVDLEHKALIVNVHNTEPEAVSMDTKKLTGKFLFCALQLRAKNQPTFTPTDLQKEALEHAWNIPDGSVSTTIMTLIRMGYFIKADGAYRLPQKVTFNIAKEEKHER